LRGSQCATDDHGKEIWNPRSRNPGETWATRPPFAKNAKDGPARRFEALMRLTEDIAREHTG